MSNLGLYQVFTTIAKKVGGPLNLIILSFGVGALADRIGIKIHNDVKNKKNSKTYIFINNVVTNEGLDIKANTQFKVLNKDKDAVLVEILGFDNNPYFISYELLKNNSDYK